MAKIAIQETEISKLEQALSSQDGVSSELAEALRGQYEYQNKIAEQESKSNEMVYILFLLNYNVS